jgi:tetratricopeptide (TPR) repeat protein
MKSPLIFLIFIFASVNPLRGETLRLGMTGELSDGISKSSIFQAELLLPENERREIFAGPYSIGLSFDRNDSGRYDIKAELYGLGPDYRFSEYGLALSPGDTLQIPPQPVKKTADDRVEAGYSIMLLDDTSAAGPEKYPPGDTTYWGISESVHYRTHWVKGSLIDFTWNKVISYLEFIYNKYRESYRLSESEKIDAYIHPDPTDAVYLGGVHHYSIQPRINRIDAIYGHEIKTLTPAPACELLVYRQWGYGPRWMIVGLANYYEDSMLKIRDFINDFDGAALLELLKDEDRVESDTGSAICGAIVFRLLQNDGFAKFKKLYSQSTVLDFEKKCVEAYGISFDELLGRFLNYAANYEPAEGELDYYASLYFDRGDMLKAGKYYGELVTLGQGDKAANMKKLAACKFWLGEYGSADTVYDMLLKTSADSSEALFMKGEIHLAAGDVDQAREFYNRSFDNGFSTGGLRIASLYLDRGETDSAAAMLQKINNNGKSLLDYAIMTAWVMISRGEDADSLLNYAMRRAVNGSNLAPQDPRPYVVQGRAYALLGNYEEAMLNFKTAYLLETNLFNQAFILLEMGRTEDLLGTRDRAEKYYHGVLTSKGGEYQKALAREYLQSPYLFGK